MLTKQHIGLRKWARSLQRGIKPIEERTDKLDENPRELTKKMDQYGF